ncbi:MAG TPA: 4-(cytidine 5'-diphospho)-2-C-methyl-D-erythritol kinase, partial [Rhodospirillales bacterium]|nr:4-(cytidine 5'-diphospho)-2-C-methyl-D-erythritol kinase [Rhodospirillales bacterium]
MVSPPPVRIAAPAKINLYLHVTGRRDDGYHRLDSLIAFAGVHDALTFAAADHLTLQIKGPCASALKNERDNLVLAAARGLARLAGIEAKATIGLTKRLPVAAGMGGGSADAAAAIKGLCQLWTLDPAADEVKSLALELGADVPVCLLGKAAFVGGIGDEIAPAPALPACSIVLVNGGRKLATPAVFAARCGDYSASARFDYAPADAPELAAILAT